MSINLQKRMAEIERRAGNKCVTLVMPDGTRLIISGEMRHWYQLHAVWQMQYSAKSAGQPIPKNKFDREIEYLRDAIRIHEPTQVWQLLSVLINGHADSGTDAVSSI